MERLSAFEDLQGTDQLIDIPSIVLRGAVKETTQKSNITSCKKAEQYVINNCDFYSLFSLIKGISVGYTNHCDNIRIHVDDDVIPQLYSKLLVCECKRDLDVLHQPYCKIYDTGFAKFGVYDDKQWWSSNSDYINKVFDCNVTEVILHTEKHQLYSGIVCVEVLAKIIKYFKATDQIKYNKHIQEVLKKEGN